MQVPVLTLAATIASTCQRVLCVFVPAGEQIILNYLVIRGNSDDEATEDISSTYKYLPAVRGNLMCSRAVIGAPDFRFRKPPLSSESETTRNVPLKPILVCLCSPGPRYMPLRELVAFRFR